MCVIIIKPAGRKLPSDSELRQAYYTNPHGCGFVSKSYHYKGMRFETFLRHLHQVPTSEACIIHFRYATHGSKCKENCHPFNRGNIWFAHNGILSITPQDDMTDSETAFQNIIYPAIQRYGFKSGFVTRVVNRIIGYSKFALMDDDGNVRTFGNFINYNGRLYSNLNHINRWSRYMPVSRIGIYDTLETDDEPTVDENEFASYDDWYKSKYSRKAKRVAAM